jgi:hypothetical protein
MSIYKGVPAAASGLLLFFLPAFSCPAIDGLSLSGQTGALWVEQDGAAFYWDAGLSYKPGSNPFVEVNAGQIVSSLAQADGSLDLFRYRSGFDTDKIGYQVSGVFFRHDFLNADFGTPRFYNNGGNGYFMNNESQIHLGPVDIIPSFLFGQGSWEKGSFYWFFGKIDIPAIYGYRLSALYKKRYQLSFRRLKTHIDIIGNDTEDMFIAGFDSFIGSCTLKAGGRTLSFEGTLGWLYAAGTVEGALTMSNQHYVLFPFRFFNLTGSLNMHLGYGLVRVLYSPGIFHLNIFLGAANIFLGGVEAAYDYQMKKLFGGSEAYETIGPVNLANMGAAFLLLDAGIRSPIGKYGKSSLRFGIQKAFIIPWGYEKIINAAMKDSGTSSAGGNTGTEGTVPPPSLPESGFTSDGGSNIEIWRTILLSGLSLYLTVSW